MSAVGSLEFPGCAIYTDETRSLPKVAVTLRYLSVLERGPTDLHNLIYELAPGTFQTSNTIASQIRKVRTLLVIVFKSTSLNMGSAAWVSF